MGWAHARHVKRCGDGSVREYRGVQGRERFLVVEECKGLTVTVDHRKTVVSAGVEKSNIVSRLTFATFYFTYYLRSKNISKSRTLSLIFIYTIQLTFVKLGPT